MRGLCALVEKWLPLARCGCRGLRDGGVLKNAIQRRPQALTPRFDHLVEAVHVGYSPTTLHDAPNTIISLAPGIERTRPKLQKAAIQGLPGATELGVVRVPKSCDQISNTASPIFAHPARCAPYSVLCPSPTSAALPGGNRTPRFQGDPHLPLSTRQTR